MPSVPGSLEVIMHIHAGTVMGGTIDSSGPHVPLSLSFEILGMSPAYWSKTCSGGAQSSPMIITLRFGALPTAAGFGT
jgi:hypothetical protein